MKDIQLLESITGKKVTLVENLEALEQEYESKDVSELVALKKKLYSNPDIESAMPPEEKLLNKVIARKFSEKNAAIRRKRQMNENDLPITYKVTWGDEKERDFGTDANAANAFADKVKGQVVPSHD